MKCGLRNAEFGMKCPNGDFHIPSCGPYAL